MFTIIGDTIEFDGWPVATIKPGLPATVRGNAADMLECAGGKDAEIEELEKYCSMARSEIDALVLNAEALKETLAGYETYIDELEAKLAAIPS